MVKTAKVVCQIFKFHKIQHNLFNSQPILMVKKLKLNLTCCLTIVPYNICADFANLEHVLLYPVRDLLRPVLTSFLWFFAVFFGPGPRSLDSEAFQDRTSFGPSKKGKKTGTRPDLKALLLPKQGQVFKLCQVLDSKFDRRGLKPTTHRLISKFCIANQ